MKNLCVIAAIILLASGSGYPQKPEEAKEVGRYVLLDATVLVTVLGLDQKSKPQAASEKMPLVLKIDTVTGKTWKLSMGMTNGKPYSRWELIDED
jgi:hypothetical protein